MKAEYGVNMRQEVTEEERRKGGTHGNVYEGMNNVTEVGGCSGFGEVFIREVCRICWNARGQRVGQNGYPDKRTQCGSNWWHSELRAT
jgi:hypothetical protein